MFKKLFTLNKAPMSREEFQRKFVNRLSQETSIVSVETYSDFSIKKLCSGEDDYEVSNLENAYRDYASSGLTLEERDGVFSRWVELFAKPIQSGELSAENLYPIVRSIGYLMEYAEVVEEAFNKDLQLGDTYDGPCVKPFIADMVLLLAFEGEEGVDIIRSNELIQLGLSEDEAWDRAFENALSSRFDPVFEQINEAGLAAASCPNEQWMTPTLLIYSDLWQNLMINNELDALLIAVPCRSGVFFADANLHHAEDMMHSVIADMLKEHHPQSSQLLRVYRGSPELEIVA